MCTELRARCGARSAGELESLLRLLAFDQRYCQSRGECVTGSGRIDRLDVRRLGECDVIAVPVGEPAIV